MRLRNRRKCWETCRDEIETKAPGYRKHRLLGKAWMTLVDMAEDGAKTELGVQEWIEDLLSDGKIAKVLYTLLVAILPYLWPIILAMLV